VKICLHSPYFPDHFGGGERHILDIATHAPADARVWITFPKQEKPTNIKKIREAYESFYGASLKNITFAPSPIGTNTSFLKKLLWTKQFSHLFAVSDGSLFFSLAQKNIAHLQIPFTQYPGGFLNKLKLRFWQLNTNSYFTKSVIESNWQTSVSSVLQPMVDTSLFSLQQKKEKIILHVGRFFTQLHSKRQDILVENFRQLLEKHPELKDWKLVLVGSVEDTKYMKKIIQMSADLPVLIHSDCSRAELLDLYARASVYWHATGFGVDEIKHPEKVEHFGITTLEAMAAGAAPVVVAKGGQREILDEDLLPLAWDTSVECVAQTNKLLADSKLLEKFQSLAKKRAIVFGEERFAKQVVDLFSSI